MSEAAMRNTGRPRARASIGDVGVLLITTLVVSGCVSAPRSDEPSPQPEPFVPGMPTSTPLAGTAGNGLIAYSSDGDIHLGDPATGATRPITRTPEFEVNPIFSPDGTRIAFVRGDLHVDPALVVVRTDGSDERVVLTRSADATPSGPFAWTPDGGSLVAGVDLPLTHFYDGVLAVVDAAGVDDLLLLTPPLPKAIGAMPFNGSAQVAPMLRPPAGDLILAGGEWDGLVAFTADLATSTELAGESLAEYEPFYVEDATWSPDGTMIAIDVAQYDDSRRFIGEGRPNLFLVDGDGSSARPIAEGKGAQWSPDCSTIAYERRTTGIRPTATIVLIDPTSGEERVLESTRAEQKTGATVHTTSSNEYHDWFYEAWSWSPDGRSLLVLERHGAAPWVVDLASDTVTRLPWPSDSGPSWQRIPPG